MSDFTESLESNNLNIPSKMNTKVSFQRDLEGLLYYMQAKVFKEVYDIPVCYYELDDLQEKIDKLEEDGEFPACYYRVKEYLERLKEGYY